MNNFAQRRKAKLRPEYPLAPNCRRSWWNMTGSTPASEHFNAKNATQMCRRAHKAWISNAISFQFCRIFTRHIPALSIQLADSQKKETRGFEKVSRLPRTSAFYNWLQLLSSVWIFLGSPGTTCIFRNHAWNLQRGSLFVQTKYEKCYYERPTPTLHKREHIAGILFHVLENKRSCGPKWETMRNNEAQSGPMNSK